MKLGEFLSNFEFSDTDLEPYLEQIATFADSNRDSFGFLPRPCYAEAISRGRIWIYKQNDSVIAYLFFGGRFPNISVMQLFVAQTARKSGLGRMLIDRLRQHAISHGFQTISAKVAADLPANTFWEKMGLLVQRQLKGGQTKNRLINARLLELPHNSLWGNQNDQNDGFSAFVIKRPLLAIPNYALDLNIFFDVLKNRPHVNSALSLLSAAMDSKVRLCVTHEFVNELSRHAVIGNDPVLLLAKGLPTLPKIQDSVLRQLTLALKKLIFPDTGRSQSRAVNDQSDLIHLAASIHHKAFGFVTREKAILRCAEQLRSQYGLDVVSPTDLVTDSFDNAFASFSVSVAVGTSDLHLSVFAESSRSEVEDFLHDTIRLSKQSIALAMNSGTSIALRKRLLATTEGKIVGFSSWIYDASSDSTIDSYIFIDEAMIETQLFVDHVLQKMCDDLPDRKFCTINLNTQSSQFIVRNTATERGFLTHESIHESIVLRRLAFKGVLTHSRWNYFAQQLTQERSISLNEKFPTFSESINTGIATTFKGQTSSKPIKLLPFETFFSPLLLLTVNRPSTIVPIQETYANELLNLDSPQKSLLLSKEALLRIERAYFGKAGFEKSFSSLGLVVFYISGSRNGKGSSTGRKAAVGIARVTFAGKRPASGIKEELGRLGVLESAKLASLADKTGNLSFFTFDNFVLFPQEVTYLKLKKMNCISGANLVTSQKLTYEQLLKIVEAGFTKC